MGNTIEGLTIRIAANVTDFKRDIKSANSAINSTQRAFGSLRKSLRLDPANVSLIESMMRRLEASSFAAATKANSLRASIQALESEKGVAELAKDTTKLAVYTAKCTQQYDEMDNELAAYYDKLKKIAAQNGITFDEKKPMKAANALKEIGKLTEQDIVHLKALRGAWKDAANNLDMSKKATSLVKQREELKIMLSTLNETSAQAIRTGGALRSISNNSAYDKLVSETRILDSALESARAEAKILKDALAINPNNLEATKQYAKIAGDEYRILRQKVDLARNAINALAAQHGINIGKDLKNASANAARAESNLAKVKTQATRVAAELESANGKLKQLKANTSTEKSEIAKWEAKVKTLSNEYTELVAKEKKATEAFNTASVIQQISKMISELRLLESESNAAFTAMKTGAAGASAAIGRTGSAAARAGSQISSSMSARGMSQSFSGLRSLAASMSTYVTSSVTIASRYILRAAEEIDSAYRDMRKTVDGTEEQFESLKQSAMEFSSTSIISTQDILEIEAMGGQLGICVDNLGSFAETVSNINVATNLEADEAAEDLGKLSNIMGLTESEYSAFGDALVRLGNNTATMESDIVNVTMRFASLGTQVGMSADEILAWADASSTTGIKAEAAGTAMQRTIAMIEAAVARGDDSLDGFAAASGLSAEEFAIAWKQDASSALLTFVAGLANIDKKGESVEKTLQDLGINGVRQKNLLEALANEYNTTADGAGTATAENNKLVDSLKMSNDAFNGVTDQWGAAGDAAREAEKKTDGFSGAVGIMRNNIKNAGVSVGDALIPAIEKISSTVSGVVKWFDSLSDSEQEMALKTLFLVTAFGPVANVVAAVGQSVTGAAAAFAEGSGAIFALGTALGAKSFIGAVAATSAVAGLVAGLAAFGIAAKKQIDYTNRLDASHSRLADSLAESNYAFSNIPESVDRAAKSYYELKSETEQLVREHEKAAEKIHDSLDEAYDNTASLEIYKNSIEDLMGKSKLTSTEISKLAMQIDAVNDACGSDLYVDDATGAIYNMSEASEATVSSLDELIDGIQETSSKADAAKLDQYQATIDNLGEKAVLTAGETDALKEAIAYVNDAAGTNYVLDEETGSIKNLDEAAQVAAEDIDNLIESQQRLAKANAYQESYQDVLQEQVATSRELNGIQEDMVELLNDKNAAYEETSGINLDNGEAIHYKRASGELQGYMEKLNEEIDVAMDAARAEDELAAKTALSSDAAGTLAEVMGVSSKEMNSMFKEAGVSVDEFATALESSGVSMSELNSLSSEQWAKILETCDGSVESMIQSFNSLKTGTTGISDEVMQGILQGFHAQNGQLSIEGESMAAQLYEALTGQDYGSAGKVAIEAFLLELTGGDVETVAALIGEDVDAGLVAGILGKADLPAEAVEIMSDTTLEAAADALGVHSPSTKFKEFGEFCDEGLAEGIESGTDSVVSAAVDMCTSMLDGAKGILENTTLGQKFIELFGGQVSDGSPTVGTAVGSVAQTAADMLSKKIEGVTAGKQLGEQYADDIRASDISVRSASELIAQTANSAISKKANSTSKAGASIGADFAKGITSKKGEASSAAANISAESAQKFAAKSAIAKTHGVHTSSNFAAGIKSGTGEAQGSAASVANAAAGSFGGGYGEAHSSGNYLAQGFASGITSGEYSAINAAANLVAKALSTIRSKGKEGSPWKTTIQNGIFAAQGLAEGIEQGSREATFAAGKLATDTINSLNKGITSASYEALQMNIDAAVKTGGVFDDMKANMVTKYDIQSAVEAAIAGKNFGYQSVTQSVGNITFNDDDQIKAVISNMIELILQKRGM